MDWTTHSIINANFTNYYCNIGILGRHWISFALIVVYSICHPFHMKFLKIPRFYSIYVIIIWIRYTIRTWRRKCCLTIDCVFVWVLEFIFIGIIWLVFWDSNMFRSHILWRIKRGRRTEKKTTNQNIQMHGKGNWKNVSILLFGWVAM